jgi:acyl carrier protein
MTREHIHSVIVKHLANAVEGLDPATIDGSQSMKHYGANSLDIVEVVSASMRELKVKVPRSDMGKLSNISGLVDLLHQASLAQSASAPAPGAAATASVS